MKADGTIRICGDFKLTVNKVSKLDRYPLPRIEDLFTNLSGGVAFTKLDLSQAYQQLELDDVSKQFTVFEMYTNRIAAVAVFQIFHYFINFHFHPTESLLHDNIIILD